MKIDKRVKVTERDKDRRRGFGGLMEHFAGYATDNASYIVLRDLLVNGEVKEAMEAFGLGIGDRGICERDPLSHGT